MKFEFTHDDLADFASNIRREWAVTNGIGGYAGSSILGAFNRTHQGYLIASLHPPVERFLVFAKTNEAFVQNNTYYSLETSQHAGDAISKETLVNSSSVPDVYKAADTVSVASDFVPRKPIYTEGNKYQTAFVYDGTVTFEHKAGDLTVVKQLAMTHKKNQTALAYTITNTGKEASFTITPLMNYREHNANVTPDDLKFSAFVPADETLSCKGFGLIPDANPEIFTWIGISEGTLVPRSELYDVDMQLQTEVDNEVPGLDCHYTPYDICFTIPSNSTVKFSLVCVTGEIQKQQELLIAVTKDTAFDLIKEQKKYLDGLLEKANFGDDDFANALTIAADQFLSDRESTKLTTVLAGLPWFTDWGRDTMIAFTGLTLCTKRFDKAAEILVTFAKYVHNGMVPNMFPDNGQAPLYNTVDASLWYFYAVEQYLKYVDTTEAYDFIQKEIYPSLKEIIQAYQKGTDFSIYMDDDYLIHAGSGVDQVTWMDVRVGDWVVTPRHGKPVEINALWYNALCVMEMLANHYGEDASMYASLAEKVKESFVKEFWYEEGGYLYDVVDKKEKDESLRPNQIYACSLPHRMLSKQQMQSVMKVVESKLYAGPGIRSLSPDHKDYHPIYIGSLPKRDAAYHQGTAWGFLMGGFITGYLNAFGRNDDTFAKMEEFLTPVKAHLTENCIGSICEIFDGDAPHNGRGCYAQAWSIGEVLRCYTER